MGTRIIIRGWGAVSPAGWGADPLAEATLARTDLPTKEILREGKSFPALGRPVPQPSSPPPYFRNPRLRRASAIGRFGVAAALEALGGQRSEVESGNLRTGIVYCEMNGIVEYSRRFYQQVLENPAYASPILFPETVYNAPSSHLSALLGTPEINYTLLGDSSQFVAGLDVAAQWLSSGRIDACLVVAAEELDWLSAEALQLFEAKTPATEGAAALFLERSGAPAPGDLELTQIAGPLLYPPTFRQRVYTGRQVRDELSLDRLTGGAFLVDGSLGGARTDLIENAVWDSWPHEVISPLHTTGAAFSVGSGWQCAIAAHLLQTRPETSAVVSALGGTQQAAAAVFHRI